MKFPDSGAVGKLFEKIFIKALELVDLDYEKNSGTGRTWDIKPKGSGWDKFISGKPVNIKAARTVWMFASKELGAILPWNNIKGQFDDKKVAAKVKRFLNKLGVNQVIYLKPKDQEIQSKLISAVRKSDTTELNNILKENNFLAEKLGKNYQVRILTKENRVSSITIDKGQVFMRSERPRQMGGSEDVVAFRAPKPEISTIFRKVKM